MQERVVNCGCLLDNRLGAAMFNLAALDLDSQRLTAIRDGVGVHRTRYTIGFDSLHNGSHRRKQNRLRSENGRLGSLRAGMQEIKIAAEIGLCDPFAI